MTCLRPRHERSYAGKTERPGGAKDPSPMSEQKSSAGQAVLAPVADLAGYRAVAREPVDLEAAEQAAADLLRALGADLESEHLRETPRRVAAAYGELLTPVPFSATTF